MKLESVLQFLENKTILVTGGAGFLAKIFVEKVLRVQPNVKKLHLLLRAADAKSATQRLHSEVLGKELFRVVKEKYGPNFSSLISEKVTVVPGDITCEDLGVADLDLREQLWAQIDVIVNLAATTNFDERYDVALGVNTYGAKYVIEFAKKCSQLMVLVHVSTSYVSGETEGLIKESPYRMGETLNGASGLDIDAEKSIVEEKLDELRKDGASEKETRVAMKELGIKRAKVYGWPNTTYKEPFPGWAEGVRTVDSLLVGYATGKLTCFLGDINGVVDMIPADMVVNSMMVAMVAHANQPPANAIYQVGSSVRNPVQYSSLQDYGLRYFTQNPWRNKDGKPIKVGKVTVLKSMASFRRYMAIRYLMWLKGLELVNTAFCHSFNDTCSNLNRKLQFVMRLVELYRPYLFFKGIFDDTNTEKLRAAARESGSVETDLFYFDPKCIDWEGYAMNTHIPGVVKYVFK
ncbi:hypothetical protein NL676_031207 [Syzygium grande]|nr:hypothetical protein NL676_031207 [Syzygium grande]